MDLFHEYEVLLSYPRNMPVLLIVYLIYALLRPDVDIFVDPPL